MSILRYSLIELRYVCISLGANVVHPPGGHGYAFFSREEINQDGSY